MEIGHNKRFKNDAWRGDQDQSNNSSWSTGAQEVRWSYYSDPDLILQLCIALNVRAMTVADIAIQHNLVEKRERE